MKTIAFFLLTCICCAAIWAMAYLFGTSTAIIAALGLLMAAEVAPELKPR